jgi:hypothetical protein
MSAGKGLVTAVAVGLVMAGGAHGKHHHHHHGGGTATLTAHHLGSASGNVALGQRMAARRGWTGGEFSCLYVLWSGESGWRVNADTRASGLDPAGASVYAYGIPQARPAYKMAAAGADWQTNPRTQIRWGLDYIERTYGSPCGALNFKRSHGNAGY